MELEQNDTNQTKVCRSMDRVKNEIKFAIIENDLAKVQSLARKSYYNFADPKLENCVLLRQALYLDDSDIAMWLLEQNCSVNGKSNEEALKVAIRHFYNDIVSIMLKRGAHPEALYNEYEYNALQEACECYNVEAVKLILASAEPNIVNIHNKKNMTAVHLAVINKNLEILDLLLKCNPNLELTFKKCTALHAAIVVDADQQVIKALLNAGADINGGASHNLIFTVNDEHDDDVETKYFTPLDLAIMSCNLKLAEVLLMHNANFSRDNIGILNDRKVEFVKPIVLLKYMKKFVHPNILTMISQFDNFEQIQQSFLFEIENMKKTKIIDSISFYDILSKEFNALASYGKNKRLIQAVVSRADISKEFPHYYEQFIDQFIAAQERAHALKKCLLIFNKVLPLDVSEKIFDYLDIEDLNHIISIEDISFMDDIKIMIPCKQ